MAVKEKVGGFFNEFWAFASKGNATQLAVAVVVGYGHLIQVSINFLIVALSIFLVFKLATSIGKRFKRKQETGEVPPPEPTPEELLLTEIRDLLREQVHTPKK